MNFTFALNSEIYRIIRNIMYIFIYMGDIFYCIQVYSKQNGKLLGYFYFTLKS